MRKSQDLKKRKDSDTVTKVVAKGLSNEETMKWEKASYKK